jgi:hypothetical protein
MPVGAARVAIFGATGVLSDDYSPSGNPLTAVLDSQPANGHVTLNANGSFAYTPNPGFVGLDTFRYHVTDGTNTSDEGTVSIQVTGNLVVGDQFYATPAGQALTINTPGLLSASSSPSGNPLTPVLDSQTQNGTVTVNSDGSFTYTPLPSFVGTDTFTFHATDARNNSNEATVSIQVGDGSTAADGLYSTPMGQNLVLNAPGVLRSDYSPTGNPPMLVLDSRPTNGTVTLNQDGSFSYAPSSPTFVGFDSFTYHANDGTSASNTATVWIQVGSPPVVPDSYYTTSQNQALTVSPSSLLTGATDPNGEPLSIRWIGTPLYGSIVENPDGSFTYTPQTGYIGVDSVVFAVTDSSGATREATAHIAVLGGAMQGEVALAVYGLLGFPSGTPAGSGSGGTSSSGQPSLAVAMVDLATNVPPDMTQLEIDLLLEAYTGLQNGSNNGWTHWSQSQFESYLQQEVIALLQDQSGGGNS